MALKPCTECKRPISETAKACPACGAPNMAAVYKARRQAVGLVVSIAAAVVLIYRFIQQ